MKTGYRELIFGCTVNRAPACTGENVQFAPNDNNDNNNEQAEIHDLRASGFKGKVMSLFCEPSRSFSSVDPDQSVSGGSKKISRRSRRHTKRLSELSAPDAHLESQPKKASLSLNPWMQESGRSRTSTTLCGDGLFYAAGGNGGAGACINPAQARSVEVGVGLSRTSTTLCGDGLFYAAGGNGGVGACINPAQAQSVEVEGGLENSGVDVGALD